MACWQAGDGGQTVLCIGHIGQNKKRRATCPPYYVRVAGYGVQNFVEKARDYFLQAPPTPAPAATPTRSP